MVYEIIKLIKKSSKREEEFHRKQAEFLGQMERDFHANDIDSLTLKSSAQQGGLKKYGTLMKLWGWA